MKRWYKAGRTALILAVAALLMAGCSGTLDPQGERAKEQYFLIVLSFAIMALVMIVVFALFFIAIIRYRRRKGDTGYPEQVAGNHKLEIIWTVIPFMLILFLAIFTVTYAFKHDEVIAADEAVNIQVTAHQFWWEFNYADYGIRTAQDLVLPENSWVNVELTSADVIHSFWIPQLTGKTDTNPGLTKTVAFKTGEPGVYKGKCAELCGEGHALMDFKAVVLSEDEFNAWVANMQEPAPAPTTPAAVAGEEVFGNYCISCHAVTSDKMSLGPNLKGFADRETVGGFRENNDTWLREWIINPQEVKPGATMPAFGDALTEEELNNLIQYIRTLK
jgi:cytochrome c oxidase subunit 2